MRIFSACLATETNTFAWLPTGMASFEEYGVYRGDGSLKAPDGVGSFVRDLPSFAEPGGHAPQIRRSTRFLMCLIAALALCGCAQTMRENWSRIGAGLSVRRVQEAQLNEQIWETGGTHALPFDAVLVSYGSALLDTDVQWGCDTFPPHGFKVTRYCDHRVDKLLASLTRVDGHANRLRIFAQIQQIINSAVPQIVLVQPTTLFVIGSRVHGIYLNAWSIYDHFSNVDTF
jgi:hypothetical protein